MGGVFCLAMLLVFVSCSPSSNNGLIIVQPPKTASPEAVAAAVDIAGIVEDAANKKPGIDITSVKDATVTYDSFVALSQTAEPEPTPTSKSIEMIIGFSGYDNGSATITDGQMEITFTGAESTDSIAIDSFTATITQNLTVKLNGTAKTYSVGGAEIKGSITATAASSTATADIAYTFSNASGASLALTSSITVGGSTVNASGISGDGDSAGSAMTFTTADQLVAFAKSVNNGTESTSGRFYALGADINLSGIDWEPIGTNTHPFQGSFDGNGATISNISIKDETTPEGPDYGVGFFGLVKADGDISIKNLNLASGKIESLAYVAGSIVGRTAGSGTITIENCTNNVPITSDNCAGGILGLCWQDPNGSTIIRNCHNTAEMQATGDNDVAGAGYDDGKAGGIVGAKHGYQGYLEIDSCSNSGHIHGGIQGDGGLIGFAGAGLYLHDSINSGAIGGTDSPYAGGMVGLINVGHGFRFERLTNTGSVTATDAAGGMLARLFTGFGAGMPEAIAAGNLGIDMIFDVCSNSGEIKNEGAASINDGLGAGGIIGYSGGIAANTTKPSFIDEAAFTNWSLTMKNCTSTGNVTGNQSAGGLLGTAGNRITIEGSNTVGSEVQIAVTDAGVSSRSGALVGYYYSGTDDYILSIANSNGKIGELKDIGNISKGIKFTAGTLHEYPVAANGGTITFSAGTSVIVGDETSEFSSETTKTYSGGNWT